MKQSFSIHGAGLLAIAALTAAASANPAPRTVVMRDAATHEQLSLALRKADQRDPMKHLKPAEGGDPAAANRPKDILAASDIISFRGLATLVPKRAILQAPKNYAAQLKFEPGARFVSWLDFYAANRGWITTVEVSRTQAEGNEAIGEETQKFLGTCRNLVVATYKGGPISVLPLKQPAAETAMQQPKPATP